MRHVISVVLCAFVLFCVSGCTKKPVTSPTDTSEATETPAEAVEQTAMPTPAPSPTPPYGIIDFRPNLEIAFTPVCSTAPAGTGPQSGYTVSLEENSDVSDGDLRVPDYGGADGTYNETSGLASPNPTFSIVLKTDSLVSTRDSSITMTIRNNGREGFSLLEHFRVNGESVDKGTITWVCTELNR